MTKFLFFVILLKISSFNAQVKNDVKQINLNYDKGLIFIGKNNSFLRNIVSSDNKLDSIKLVEMMEKLVVSNFNFHIPKSFDLLHINTSSYSIPGGKVRKECVIPFSHKKCSKTYSCQFSNHNTLYWMQSTNPLFHLEHPELSHPHACSNCKDWNTEYKRKTACNRCKDRRVTYCGKTFLCQTCGGKGWYEREAKPMEVINIDEYLINFSINKPIYIFYFNDANNFGIYDMTINKEIKYGNYLDSKILNSISFLLLEGEESVKKMIEDYKIMAKKNDDFVSKEIELLIEQGKISAASKKFSQLYSRSYYELKYIQNLISYNRINEAYVMSKSLNIVDKNIISQLETKKIINENKLKKFLASNNIDSSIYYYKLNPPDNNLKILIQDKLSEINKLEIDYIIDDKFVKFVKDSLLNKLNILNSADYILHMSNNGNCYINDAAGDVKLQFKSPEYLIPTKNYDEFEFKINSKSKFSFLVDSNKYFVKGLILDDWYESRIQKGTVVLYYAKKKNKEFVLSNKKVYIDQAAGAPEGKYDVLTKLTYFEYEKFEENSWDYIINAPAFLNGIPLGDLRVSGSLLNKCLSNFKNKIMKF